MRLLFVSRDFPDGQDPARGAENVEILRALSDRWEIRAVVLRSGGAGWHPRASDVALLPEFVSAPSLPVLGPWWNPRLAAHALRRPLDRLRRDWPFDVVLASRLHPDVCAVARLADEFRFRFVALALHADAEPALRGAFSRKVIASHLFRAAGVVTGSPALAALVSRTGLRKERLITASTWQNAAEACHRLLLTARA